VQRLKDKAGNKSNASSEVEYAGTLAIRVGEEGKRHPRDPVACAPDAAGLRGRLGRADAAGADACPAAHDTRRAFGTSIAERPMMANVLADMAVEVEAATLMALRVAKATDHIETSEHETAACARRHAGGQVLQLLARAGGRLRGAAVPRRQRLHRGEPDGARCTARRR
jgi:putative acyl-CoA dehydrogenase